MNMKNYARRMMVLMALVLAATLQVWAADSEDLDAKIEAAFTAEEESRFDDAIELLLPIVDKLPADSVQLLSDCYSSITSCYFRLGQLEEALSWGERCLRLDEESGNEENLASSLGNIAAICLAGERYEVAEEYLLRSIDIERKLQRPAKLSIRLGMLSEVYIQQERLDEALTMVSEAVDIDRAMGNEPKLAIRLSQLGNVLINMRKPAEAEPYLSEACQLHRKYQNLPSLVLTLIPLGITERALNKYRDAETSLQEALTLAEQTEQRSIRMTAYIELARLYNKMQDPRAFDYLSRFMQVKDSVTNEQVQAQISDLEVRYQTKEKEQQLALSQATIRQQRMLYLGLSVLLILSIAALFFAIRAARLKEKNLQLKNRFIQLISHDLKNPALAQQKGLHLLCKYHDRLEPADMQLQLKQMAEDADAHVNLLYSLLDWARLQTGHLSYQPVRLDLATLADEVVSQHHAQAEIKGVKVSCQHQDDDCLVTADRQLTATIVRNLLSNAIKYTPLGTGTAAAEADIEVTVAHNSITVKDHGTGFDVAEQASTQASKQGTSGELGTALGLNLVRQLAQINHSELQIESKIGVGTTIKLNFTE